MRYSKLYRHAKEGEPGRTANIVCLQQIIPPRRQACQTRSAASSRTSTKALSILCPQYDNVDAIKISKKLAPFVTKVKFTYLRNGLVFLKFVAYEFL